MPVTLQQMCDAIETVVATMSTSPRTASYDELLEGVQQWPYAEVYWERTGPVDSQSGQGQTHKGTFGSTAPLIQEIHTFHIDYYARPRSQLEEDNEATVIAANALINELEDENCPPFNLEGVRNFQWDIRRVVFTRGEGGNAPKYAGFRCIITLRTY
jgi:hypothetical protein